MRPSDFLPAFTRMLIVLGATVLVPAQAAQPAAATAVQEEAARQAQLQRQARREQIQAERQAVQAQLGKDEAACYQAFAVNDCLRKVRSKARAADNALRQQELQINDEERREKADQRMRSIEERRQEQQEKLQSGEKPALRAPPSATMRRRASRKRASAPSSSGAAPPSMRQTWSGASRPSSSASPNRAPATRPSSNRPANAANGTSAKRRRPPPRAASRRLRCRPAIRPRLESQAWGVSCTGRGSRFSSASASIFTTSSDRLSPPPRDRARALSMRNSLASRGASESSTDASSADEK